MKPVKITISRAWRPAVRGGKRYPIWQATVSGGSVRRSKQTGFSDKTRAEEWATAEAAQRGHVPSAEVRETNRHPLQAQPKALAELVDAALRAPKEARRRTALVTQIVRDPRITAAVKARAAGRCEHCGLKYQHGQVHHVNALGDGGEDSLDNAIYLCLNCHGTADNNAFFNELVRISLRHILEVAA
jgi:hypothetical protein